MKLIWLIDAIGEKHVMTAEYALKSVWLTGVALMNRSAPSGLNPRL
jgi:hypothetical protein